MKIETKRLLLFFLILGPICVFGQGINEEEKNKIIEQRVDFLLDANEGGTNDYTSLFEQLEQDSRFYFLHSYYFSPNFSDDIFAMSDYAQSFPSAVNRGNIFGVQFHPEKSHGAGIQLLKNFASL